MGCGHIAFFGGGSVVVRWFLAVIVRYPVQSRTTKAKKQGVFRWFGGSVVRWFGGSVVRWFGGSVVRWFGGSVVRWLGGLVAWWFGRIAFFGGSVVRWFGGAKSHYKSKETGRFLLVLRNRN